jgi:hypothetical protein
MAAGLQPVDLTAVLTVAALNPATIAVAVWMGRQADQPQKLVVAAFAASIAGVALLWLAHALGVGFVVALGRAFVGLFTAQLVFGGIYAALAYRFRRR